RLDAGVSAMQDAGNILTRAREIAIEGSNAGNTPQALESLATEVDQLIGRLVDTANGQNTDQDLFAGAAARTKPVVGSYCDQGRPQSVTYQGSAQRAVVNIGPGNTLATLYAGSEAFQGSERGKTVYEGATGAVAGTGTDSAIGQGTLQVRHTATTYAGSSGV